MASQSTQSSSTNSSFKELTINDLPHLCNTLNPVASKCSALGLQLGVEYPQIRNIEHNYRTCEDQLREIISERLKQDPPLTWHEIVTALRSPNVGEHSLASQIESQYISPSLDPQENPASVPQQENARSPHRPTHTSVHSPVQSPPQYSDSLRATCFPSTNATSACASQHPYNYHHYLPTKLPSQPNSPPQHPSHNSPYPPSQHPHSTNNPPPPHNSHNPPPKHPPWYPPSLHFIPLSILNTHLLLTTPNIYLNISHITLCTHLTPQPPQHPHTTLNIHLLNTPLSILDTHFLHHTHILTGL